MPATSELDCLRAKIQELEELEEVEFDFDKAIRLKEELKEKELEALEKWKKTFGKRKKARS